jgi:hypothetical protein
MTAAQNFRPFLDEQGNQIGWQSADFSTVVALDQLPRDAVVPGPASAPPAEIALPPSGGGLLDFAADMFSGNQAHAAPPPPPPGFELVQPSARQPAPRSAPPPPPPGFVLQGAEALDKRTGAPAEVREMVGGAPQQDRLEQIRRYYPDAQPYQDDNFVFNDPQTNRPTLYNPPGLDYGDLPSVGRDIVSGVGGAVGAAGAAVMAPFTGGAGLLAVPAGAGIGATLGGAAYDALRMARGGVDTRGPVQRTTDAASEFGTNAMFQRAADLVPGMVRSAVTGGTSRLTGQTPQQLWNTFTGAGIAPTAGQVTGNRFLQGMEAATSKMPTGATTMGEAATRQLDTLGQNVEDLATGYGAGRGATPGTSPTEAGRALQRGGAEFVTNFRNRAETMYEDLYRTMPRDVPAVASKIVAALGRQRNELAAAPALAAKLENPTLRGYLDAIQADISPQGTLPFNVISSFRSKIGGMLSDPMTVSDIPRGELKEVYAALSADMEEAARAAGPDALRKFLGANRYYAAGLKRIEAVIDKVVQAKTPEQAYRWAMEGTQTRGGGGTKLMQLRRSMPAEEWDVVTSFVLRQMGEAIPSQQGSRTIFSPETFLTRWNQMAPDARAALFKGSKYAGLPDQLKKLLDVAAAMRDTKYMSNPSGTAGQSMFMAFLQPFGVGAGAGTVFGMSSEGTALGVAAGGLNAVAPYIVARALTNQRFVKWLTELGTTTNPNSFTAHMARLSAIAAADPAVKEYAQSVHDALRSAPPAGSAPNQPAATPQKSALQGQLAR